jgi:hypothetical protein
MRRSTRREVCLDAGKSVRLSVPAVPTASFDRLLLGTRTICVAQAGRKSDPGLKTAGNLANIR